MFQPNSPASITRATSLTTGDAIRKPKVTPSGRPDSRKPMKSGTAEQEQKGVIVPNNAARTVPVNSPLPAGASSPARRGGAADDGDHGDDSGEQQEDLRHVGDEKIDG